MCCGFAGLLGLYFLGLGLVLGMFYWSYGLFVCCGVAVVGSRTVVRAFCSVLGGVPGVYCDGDRVVVPASVLVEFVSVLRRLCREYGVSPVALVLAGGRLCGLCDGDGVEGAVARYVARFPGGSGYVGAARRLAEVFCCRGATS